MHIFRFEVEKARVLHFYANNSPRSTPRKPNPPLRLLKEKKLKKNFTGVKRLIFISKPLLDLKMKDNQGKQVWAAILLSSWIYSMCVREYLEAFCGVHVIVLTVKTF